MRQLRSNVDFSLPPGSVGYARGLGVTIRECAVLIGRSCDCVRSMLERGELLGWRNGPHLMVSWKSINEHTKPRRLPRQKAM